MNKHFPSLPRIITFSLLLGLIFLSCKQPPPAQAFSKKIVDVLPAGRTIDQADLLKYQQDYERATSFYTASLSRGNPAKPDSIYLFNQLIYCRLIVNQTDGIAEQLNTVDRLIGQLENDLPASSFLADHHFNKGRFYYLQHEPDSALHYAHLALSENYQIYPNGHLRIAQTLTLLSMIHLEDGNLTDSTHFYSLQANNLYLNHPEIQAYDWENDFVLGYNSRLLRAHGSGEFYCRAALRKMKELPFENNYLVARTKNLLAHMIKKKGDWLTGDDPQLRELRRVALYEEADRTFQEAIDIGREDPNLDLITFYVDWMINATRFPDSSRFFRALDNFKKVFSGTSLWKPHYERLLGYYYFGKDYARSIAHYTAFLELAAAEAEAIDYRVYSDSYFCLRVAWRELGDFDRSAFYAKKSFELYDCADQHLDITRPESVAQLDSSNRNCLIVSGFFAEGLLKKYYEEQREQDLQLANAYYDFIQQKGFKSLLSRDEDAFLNFQVEAGARISKKALEATFAAWELSGATTWLDRAFNYMEFMKSYLLYRDMLKEDHEPDQQYSLSDSIRLLQGQVNQILFAFSRRETEIPDDFHTQNLFKTLQSLENRRSERLDAFKTDINQNQFKISDVQDKLDPGQGLVHYYANNDFLFTIYLDRDTAVFQASDKGYTAVKAAIQSYRNSVEKEAQLTAGNSQEYLQAARSLYRELIEPFSDRLSKVNKLLIIPDQLLDPISFEALLSEDPDPAHFNFKDLPYLLHQTQVVYTTSWKVYLQNKENRLSDFRDQSIGFWTIPELISVNGLKDITQSIGRNFGENNYQIFNRERGGKQHFSEHHRQFNILHLLLHASSSRLDRFDNRILFGADKSDVLYGFELYKEKFRSHLVVLASCESAAGTPQDGEGTFSLARSFINSGIPEIIAAQFLIPQTTTGHLLSRFYKYLGQGKTASEALHLAKIDYLQTIPRDRHAGPRFWAGMVIFN